MFVRVAILACLMVGFLSASPIVLLSDFGPNNGYSVGPGITVGCGAVCWQNAGFSFAWAFTPSVTAQLSTVETEAWSFFSPPSPDLIVTIMSDASGLPGSLLESFTLPISTTADLVIGYSLAGPILSAGTQYWFAASVPDPVNEAAQVGIDSVGYIGPMASRIGAGPWLPTSASADAVFRITGATVPEPTSAWLLGAVLGLAGTLRLRKRL